MTQSFARLLLRAYCSLRRPKRTSTRRSAAIPHALHPTRPNLELLEPRLALSAVSLSFQDAVGPSTSYRGTVDTELRGNLPTTSRGAVTSLNVDGSDGGFPVHTLLRFDNIFGSNAGQIPTTAPITSARLLLNVTNPGNAMALHRMLQPWTESATWNSLGSGIQANGVEATVSPDATTAPVATGTLSIDVLASLRAWQTNPTSNFGWALLPSGTDGVDFLSREASTAATHPKLVVTFDDGTPPPVSGNVVFQDAVAPSSSYRGTVDTELRGNLPTTSRGTVTSLNVDGSDGGFPVHTLLRFDNIFGSSTGQIPLNTPITSARLLLNVTNPGNAMALHRMLQPWTESATWNSLGSGIQPNGIEATVSPDATTAPVATGTLSIDVLASLRAWQANPTSNFGWALLPSGTDGVDFSSREASTATLHPRLVVTFGQTTSTQPQYTVNQAPRLQLGNAPLTGFSGSTTDQVEILWQTVSAGSGTQDTFAVDYRRLGLTTWTSAAPPQMLSTGVDSRIVHSVKIAGLSYNADYEYRVRHLRGGTTVATWQNSFHTRLAPGDNAPFSFAAYGDSASLSTINNFRQVQDRVNQVNPALAILLGDNVYDTGTHPELDTRFDPSINPEAARWIASHIDYVGFGNHDVAANSGKPSEDSYSVPLPVAGVTSSTAPPASERPEHNYSFDYGSVHFVTFDTNSYTNPTRLDAQLKWVEADLRASNAPWKIVFGHHPIVGTPDKADDPSSNYYRQVVTRLRAAGADLLMVGHSHTYGWSYPLLGEQNGQAIFVNDTDKDYAKGAGLVELVSGVGGRSLRSGSYAAAPYMAAGFTTSTNPPAKYGFAKIDVTPTRLTVSYVAADNGAVIDRFTITAPQPASLSSTASTSSFDTNSVQFLNPRTRAGSPLAIDPRAVRLSQMARLQAVDAIMARNNSPAPSRPIPAYALFNSLEAASQ